MLGGTKMAEDCRVWDWVYGWKKSDRWEGFVSEKKDVVSKLVICNTGGSKPNQRDSEVNVTQARVPRSTVLGSPDQAQRLGSEIEDGRVLHVSSGLVNSGASQNLNARTAQENNSSASDP